MKRRWRLGRLVVSVVLVGIAALSYWTWPGISWKVKGEKPLGFDVEHGLFYTVSRSEEKYELRGYDLLSGERRKSVGLAPDLNVKEMGKSNLQEDAPEQTKMENAWAWHWLLSPNKKELLAVNMLQSNIQVIDRESGKTVRKLSVSKTPVSTSRNNAGFSKTGAHFAIQDLNTGIIVIWNLSDGQILQTIMPPGVGSFSSSSIELNHDELHIDATGRFLAYSTFFDSFVYDLADKKRVLHYGPKEQAPNVSRSVARFFDNDRSVIVTPMHIDHDYQPVQFHRQPDGQWKMMPVVITFEEAKHEFVGYSDNLLVTDCPLNEKSNRPHWLPESFWTFTKHIFKLDGRRHQLQYWDLRTGQLNWQFSFYAPHFWNYEARPFISEDGKWLSVEYFNEVTVYESTGRRSVRCWLVILGLVLLAVWSGWPKRGVSA